MRDSALKRYLDDASRYPLMDAAEEVELLKEWNVPGRRPAIRKRMVEGSLRFAVAVAVEMQRLRGQISIQDAVGEANLGLMEAAKRFDPAGGTRFITYAVWWIRQSVRRSQDESHTVRCPHSLLHDLGSVGEAENALRRTLGRNPDEAEVVDELNKGQHRHGWCVRKLRRVRELGPGQNVSGDEPLADDGPVLWDALADPGAAMPDAGLEAYDVSRIWDTVAETLTDRERMVLMRHNGADGEATTLNALGDEMGISRERVRQIERDARRKILKRHGARLREALA